MKITTKELRIQPGKIIKHVAKGQEVIITYRGKALAKIVPFKNEKTVDNRNEEIIFGLWKDHPTDKSVEEQVRDLRKGRVF
ncbi:MAG TPA: type II toxin-antitoxin system prevent-host-death family antitoxin [Rectinema sp.]|nr:type II toxin-antitoxin system prevent-host-death family antitoxin [Rectinema sp.]